MANQDAACEILVVEDSPEVLEVLVSKLAVEFPQAKITTRTAGLEAYLTWIDRCARPEDSRREGQDPFDVVITDYYMPTTDGSYDMDGCELASLIKESSNTIPVLLHTSTTNEELGKNSFFGAVNGVVPKNEHDLLFSIVHKLID
jgi:CheY-like chemotaxis protein